MDSLVNTRVEPCRCSESERVRRTLGALSESGMLVEADAVRSRRNNGSNNNGQLDNPEQWACL